MDRQAQMEMTFDDPVLLAFLNMLGFEFQRWAEGKSQNEIFDKKMKMLSLLHE